MPLTSEGREEVEGMKERNQVFFFWQCASSGKSQMTYVKLRGQVTLKEPIAPTDTTEISAEVKLISLPF